MKQVTIPITVPSGAYCWQHKSPGHKEICPFLTIRAKSTCDMGFAPLVEDDKGILKAPACAALPEVEAQ